MKYDNYASNKSLEELIRKEIAAAEARPKSSLKTYLYASNKGRHYGALPNFPRPDIIGEPVIDHYWYSDNMVPCASAFGVGDCMKCTHIPDALTAMREGISDWLERNQEIR